MTFNHGVRSSTLRWITKIRTVFGFFFFLDYRKLRKTDLAVLLCLNTSGLDRQATFGGHCPLFYTEFSVDMGRSCQIFVKINNIS